MCRIPWALVALLVWLGSAAALEKKSQVPTNPNEVEVRLSDGSRVRMLLLQSSLDIETKYGKLTVPTSDLRRIEFGIRPPEAHKIEEAVKRLGHASPQEREKAMKELIATGAPAYAALCRAAKSQDTEVVEQANKALEQIRRRVPESSLRLRQGDLIQTAEFTIVGRVLNSTLRAKSAVFGETQLKVVDLRGIQRLGELADVELEIDAAKYAVNPTQWLDTGIELLMDDDLVISASGTVDWMPNGGEQSVTGPDGNAQIQGPSPQPPGALLGRIGEHGQAFLIGANYSCVSKSEGTLYLQIATIPGARAGNAVVGSYKVKITGGRETSVNR